MLWLKSVYLGISITYVRQSPVMSLSPIRLKSNTFAIKQWLCQLWLLIQWNFDMICHVIPQQLFLAICNIE